LTAEPQANRSGTRQSSESARGRFPIRTNPATVIESALLLLLYFAYAGDSPPMVNEAHYLVKAKNFWQPGWCSADLFASSAKAHVTFYALFGWPTLFFSLPAVAWLGRIAGWTMLAVGLQRLTSAVVPVRFASLAVAAVWLAGIEYGNLAGEWVVGGIEAKVPAYGFVLLGLSCLARRRWSGVWLCFGAASAFHVLTGGWSVVAALVAWVATEYRRTDRQRLLGWPLIIGGALALLGIVPALALTVGTEPAISTRAARIYTYFRLSHHLLPADFHFSWYARHVVLLLLTAGLGGLFWQQSERTHRTGWFMIGAVGIAATGLMIGMLPPWAPDLAARLLRFYWFRLSDAVVPFMLGLVVALGLCSQQARLRGIAFGLVLVATLLLGNSIYRRIRLGVPPAASNRPMGLGPGPSEQQHQAFSDWRSVCAWAKASTPPDEVFLTPRHQMTFKWYAERAEVVNWKDVPQDAPSLIEWRDRFAAAFPRRLGHVRVTIRYDKLREFRERYGVRFMIVDRRVVGPALPLIQVYPQTAEENETYAAYELPTGGD